jgi:hypothetical protein
MTAALMNEEWRDIPGLERYKVSSAGRVLGSYGRVLKLKKCKRGYLWFAVADGKGSSVNVSVARSVCAAFNNGDGNGMDCDHINRVRDDNRPGNLRWLTRTQNLENRANRMGADHFASKLSEDLVREIRSTPHYRGLDREFATRLGVTRETVRDARLGKLWRHVHD